MQIRRRRRSIPAGWWTVFLVATTAAAVLLTAALYTDSFTSYVAVTLKSDRSGLVMEPGAKVMMNGVEVGRVSSIAGGHEPVSLTLQIDPDQVQYLPANVGAQIRATTAFGGKYVDLIFPDRPTARRLTAGMVLYSRNVSTEVNTVFQNLVSVINQIDPAKLNAVLTALADGFRGEGTRIGQSITDANQVLLALNPRSDTVRRDWHALNGFNHTYDTAADDILSVLQAVSTTSITFTNHASALDALLLNIIGFSRAGTQLVAPSRQNLIDAINILEPTTNLLLKYNPEYTCMLVGAKWAFDNGTAKAIGGNGRSFVGDATLLGANDPYVYPDNLPIVAAKGGPGGKPSCGSLPDASKMFPVRDLVTNTGWGTGLDIRPNPGLAHPCYADYLPVTRAVPQPPSIRQCLPGPAPGPVPYPGAPPYGAALYGPGGVPLWPGIPPAGTPAPVPVEGTPVAPGKIPPQPPPPAVFGAPPPVSVSPSAAPTTSPADTTAPNP